MPYSAAQPDRTAAAVTPPPTDAMRTFDGVICFGGEDWWYHNRGHFDMQMMRRFAAHMPVLYVNSIGMRMPSVSEGRMFARRMLRKVRSLTRGLRHVDDNFAVFSPIVAPAGLAKRLSMPTLPMQVRLAASSMNMRNPLLWIACPTAAAVIDQFNNAPIVYQRTDIFEQFVGVDPQHIRRCDLYAKSSADLSVFCSPTLIAREAEQCRSASLIEHGVDMQRYVAAGDGHVDEPADVRDLPKPRVGFIGGIDSHTFDAALFKEVATRLPDVHFVLVGGCSLPAGWCDLPNVTLTGRKPFEDVHAYMGACDVLIMPWLQNQWIEACNPVKLKEYLAVGRPIVSTPFGALERYRDVVSAARSADEFAAAIESALQQPGDPAARRMEVVGESWANKARFVLRRLTAAGIRPAVDVPPEPADESPARFSMTNRIEVKPLQSAGHIRFDANTQYEPAKQAPMTVTAQESPAEPELAACILLAGGMRPSPLVDAAGCSVLDLWLSETDTVLDCWLQRLRMIDAVMPNQTAVRVIGSRAVPPLWPRPFDGLNLSFEVEPRAYRGTAGLLRDLCRGYDANQHVVIIEATRYATCEVAPLWREHVRRGADITIGCNADGSLAGLYVARVGCLDDVATIGFTDFKEQFLSRAARAGRAICTCMLPGRGTLPIWSRRDLLEAAAAANAMRNDTGKLAARTGRVTSAGDYPMNICCRGARVAQSATVVDSILMPNAVVEDGACVVRCVVCSGCTIQAGADIADAVAGPRGWIPDRAHVAMSGSYFTGQPPLALSNGEPERGFM